MGDSFEHERKSHEFNSFITLTFDDEHMPADRSLNYRRDFQPFIKRMRRRMGQLRFFMCGEYGDDNFRPHYHACIFGMDFYDKKPWKKTSSGFQIFRSTS